MAFEPQEDELRLVDLLLDPQLRLELVSDCDPHLVVRGAHAIELIQPARWLQPGTVMLTTGAVFAAESANPAQRFRELVRELVAAGVAGLGYGIGVATEDVPRALVDEASRHHFAVFTVPADVPFMTVIDKVVEQTRTPESMSLRRALQIQDQLLDALSAVAPEQELVSRLAGILRSSVLLYNEVGELVASAGRAPANLIRSQLRGASDHRRFSVGKWHMIANAIEPGGEPHWLVVGSTRHELPDALARTTVEVAVRLLNAIERSRYRAAIENRSRQAAFVHALAAGELIDQFSAETHLEALRFGHRPQLRLMVMHAGDDYDGGRWRRRAASVLDAVEDDVADLARLTRAPVMFARIDDELVGLIPTDVPAATSWALNLPETVVCGFSERFRDVHTGPAHLRNARRALRTARTRGRRWVEFESVDLADWLLTGHDRATTAAKAHDQLAPIADDPDLMALLRTYFDQRFNVATTAEQLGVHPNTVRYRLKRLEEQFGDSLRSPSLITALHLSLEVLALEAARPADSAARAPSTD
ncbi:PucR family transcriptional regulator [Tsukamurella serpentis]